MLKAGAGTKVINPPVGTSLAGYFHERVSTGVHDDLLAKALVLGDGKIQVAIVVCDLLRVMRREVDKARELASEKTGIPPGNIFISATHTHTGPETNPMKPMVPVRESYLAKLPQMIADAVISAHASLQPATLRLGEEYEDRLAFNRRFRMTDGSVRFNPGKLNPDIIGPDGPIDPQLNVLRVDGEDGMPIAIIANYTLHPDVMGGNEISADFPGESSRIVSSLYESRPMVVYMQGACGNINHLDVSDPRPQKGWYEVIRISRVLAGKILAASELAVPMSSETLAASTQVLDILYHPLTDELRAKAAETRKLQNPGDFERVQADLIEDYQLEGKTAAVEVRRRSASAMLPSWACPASTSWSMVSASKTGRPSSRPSSRSWRTTVSGTSRLRTHFIPALTRRCRSCRPPWSRPQGSTSPTPQGRCSGSWRDRE